MTARQRFLEVVRKHAYPGPEGPVLWSSACEAPSRAQLRAIQEDKLSAAFDYLFESSAFYRERFRSAGLEPGSVRSLDDLRRVPVTRKLDWIPDIEAHPPWGTFSPLTEQGWRDQPWLIFSTSGTTRRPRLFRHTTHDRDIWAWMNARALWSYGVRPGEIALNCFYYGASVAAWGLHEGLVRLGCSVVPGGAMPPERRAAVVKYVRPAVILGTPSGLLTLGRRVQEQGDDPAAQGVRTLVCAGEPGAAIGPTRRRLEALWGAQVHDDFGCTEIAMAPLGYTCQAEAGKREGDIAVHLMEDALIVEVLDPETLEPVPVGRRGTLVVSNLYSEAAPFLRFDMGDWIQLRDDPCACGRTHVRAVGGLLGRNDHCLKIKGLQFFPSTFEDAIRSIDGLGDEYRVELLASSEPDRDDVEIVIERGADASLTDRHVASRLRGILGITVVVTLVDPGTLPRSDGKGVRFIDKRTEAATGAGR